MSQRPPSRVTYLFWTVFRRRHSAQRIVWLACTTCIDKTNSDNQAMDVPRTRPSLPRPSPTALIHTRTPGVTPPGVAAVRSRGTGRLCNRVSNDSKQRNAVQCIGLSDSQSVVRLVELIPYRLPNYVPCENLYSKSAVKFFSDNSDSKMGAGVSTEVGVNVSCV